MSTNSIGLISLLTYETISKRHRSNQPYASSFTTTPIHKNQTKFLLENKILNRKNTHTTQSKHHKINFDTFGSNINVLTHKIEQIESADPERTTSRKRKRILAGASVNPTIDRTQNVCHFHDADRFACKCNDPRHPPRRRNSCEACGRRRRASPDDGRKGRGRTWAKVSLISAASSAVRLPASVIVRRSGAETDVEWQLVDDARGDDVRARNNSSLH